jgi:dipeptidyl aminopeptidase/acylaminoacyl peptidase
MKPQEIYTACGKQLTKLNAKALRGKYIAKPERLNIISHKREIRGFVYKPIDFKPGKKYPTILYIHGGPKSDLGPVFFHHFQYWCSEGYMVICCDPFGSDGRGSEFADMRGKYGMDDYEDFMNFCDAAMEKYPEIDTKNFFETGISYGGFMTNWIIGHTDRFTACVSQAPVTNWISMSISDIGAGFAYNQCDGTPWDGGLEKVWRASPLKYADKVKTPTLFIHAINDYRCPLPESLQMFAALKAFGVETKCFLIRGESHSLFEIGSPVHRVRYLKEMTKWFEQHRTSK